ncbi:hypothetical protein SAMN02745181_0125 [Rubritalea squalenifaciens DSM 18772]|uniref:Uncharacterized protein n=2 Tax=Rubritalea TaxID=361050 RepID=A0A1M6B5L3_9BACT|nr:hypothetical protein SAMN02745181_0125 [Rubritalea squalenifaciens DSM 18772]
MYTVMVMTSVSVAAAAVLHRYTVVSVDWVTVAIIVAENTLGVDGASA